MSPMSPSALQWGRGCSAAEGLFSGVLGVNMFEASMGPRLFSRGRRRGGDRRERSSSSFNGAAAVQPRKGRALLSQPIQLDLLQWGRGCSAAEGPGRNGPSPARTPCFNGAAAVQPRKVSLRPLLCPANRTLQWGRGCSAAEGTRRCLPSSRIGCFNGAAAVQPRKGR